MAEATAFGYGDLNFTWGDHICTIFENRSQQMSVMVPFMSLGIREEQRCVWVSPEPAAEAFRQEMMKAGADLPTLEGSGQLVIIPAVDYYLHNGVFEPEKTLELAQLLCEDSVRHGYNGIRATGDVSWIGGNPVDLALWEGYERAFTERLRRKPVVTVCQYDQRRFSGAYVVAALHTHPIVILGETVCRNPFFAEEPEELAGERRQIH